MTEQNDDTPATKAAVSEELRPLANQITARFLVPPEDQQVLSEFDRVVESALAPFSDIGAAFRTNVEGFLSTVSIPYYLAHSATIGQHFQRLHMAERIRLLKLQVPGETLAPDIQATREASAKEKAESKLSAFARSATGRDVIIGDSLQFLKSILEDERLSLAADEILRQGILLCWGAFEVVARDLFIALVNGTPDLAQQLVNDPVAKRRFELPKLSIETLGAHGFDLSKKMGTLLSQQQDMSDLNSIKAAFAAIHPRSDDLRNDMEAPELRQLHLARNLIVHRRGIIDQRYFDESGCTQHLGDRIKIVPDVLEKYLIATIKLATTMIALCPST